MSGEQAESEVWLVIRMPELRTALTRAQGGSLQDIDSIMLELYANSTKEWHPK